MKQVELLGSKDKEFRLIKEYIVSKASEGQPLQILEAGCGNKWPLTLDGVQYSLTGVDLDQEALELRKSKLNDLDEIIVGDLRSVRLAANKYDIIYNSFVLEHVENARGVLENFYHWLKPGGILVLRIPDRDSVYGLVTRVTPHWFHVFYKRRIMGIGNAGKPGCGPYPTVYDAIVSKAGIHAFCDSNGFVIKEEYGTEYLLYGQNRISALIEATKLSAHILSFMSLRKLTSRYNNLLYILEKEM